MDFVSKSLLSITVFLNLFQNIYLTIDLNAAQLQYLADHLTPEECRTLIAAAHFESYEKPKVLDQAERKIPKDLSCIQLLHHWNSDEGKGQTHEVLEHRLRQMEKYELADWLGKRVFRSLGEDLNKSLDCCLDELATTKRQAQKYCTLETSALLPTLEAAIENDETQWTFIDSIAYAVIIGLTITIVGLCFRACCIFCSNSIKKRRKRRKYNQMDSTYEVIETGTSGSDSEDKFDVRDYRRQE